MRLAGPVPPAFDASATKLVAELKAPAPLLGCRFDPSGAFALAGGQNNVLHRWELTTGKLTAMTGHQSWARAVAFADGHVFSGGYDGALLTWALDGDKPLREVAAHKGWLRALAVSPDGKTLASCGNDHLVKLWSVPDGKPRGELAGHDSHVYNVAFHPDGRHLVSADHKGVVQVWDLAKRAAVRAMDVAVLCKYDPVFGADIGGVRGLAVSPDGGLVACAGITNVTNAFAGVGNPAVVLLDWATGKAVRQLKPRAAFQGTGWGVAFHPSGLVVGAAGGNGGMLYFWTKDAAEDVFALKVPNNVRDLALHPDGRRLAVPCFDGVLRVYDTGPKK